MGTWGTEISSNDTFEDIYSDFFDMYNNGLDVPEITKIIVSANIELQSNYEHKNSFWFALAKAQWECGALDQEVYEKVQTIIKIEDDLKLWAELNGTTSDVKKRKKVLEDFLEKISKPIAKIKKRKKPIIRKPVFKKGDCLVFGLKNGNYGGALVLEAEQDTEFGLNMLAVTTLDQSTSPTIKDFENANILTQKHEGFPGEYTESECIIWCDAQFYKKAQINFDVIGQVEISKEYNSIDHYKMAGPWDSIPEFLDNLSEYEQKHGKAILEVKLKEWR